MSVIVWLVAPPNHLPIVKLLADVSLIIGHDPAIVLRKVPFT